MDSKRIANVVGILLLLASAAVTTVGLSNAIWFDVLPWSGVTAISQYAGLLLVYTLIALVLLKQGRLGLIATCALFVVGLSVLSGALWPIMVTTWIAISSLLFGKWILSFVSRNAGKDDPLMMLLAGVGTYGVIVGLLAHLPVNYHSVYAAGLLIPIVLNRHYLVSQSRELFSRLASQSSNHPYLDTAIAVIAALHFTVALMPEVGHDALAMHLFIPAHVSATAQWGFDVGKYVWAVMPLQGDWIFTISFMLAGETAARLTNAGFIFLLAWMIRELALWAGGGTASVRWGILIFLSTPLTFAVSGHLFIESVWATFFIGGFLALLRARSSPQLASVSLMTAALLFGLAAATKAVTLALLPLVALVAVWALQSLFTIKDVRYWAAAVSIFGLVGGIPYITAWWLTNNPVFPFFNGFFKSAFYPPINFDSSQAIFGKGLSWDILYRATFSSHKYLEATAGAPGFQWIMLFFPAAISLALKRCWKPLFIAVISVMIIVLVFQSVSYLRYAFPAWVMVAAVMGIAIANSNVIVKAEYIWRAVAAFVVGLNLLFLSSASQYRQFPLASVFGAASREEFLLNTLPIRNAVAAVNRLNIGGQPVAVFGPPLVAGLTVDALHTNWYNTDFLTAVNKSTSGDDLARLLKERSVEYLIWDSSWGGDEWRSRSLSGITEPIVNYGPVSVRRLSDIYLFADEKLKDVDFDRTDSWSISPGAKIDRSLGVATATVISPISQSVATVPGQRYRNSLVARCVSGETLGRVQINWLNSEGGFLKADIKTFTCTADWSSHYMDVTAPPQGSTAIVYTTSHTTIPIEFSSNSLKK